MHRRAILLSAFLFACGAPEGLELVTSGPRLTGGADAGAGYGGWTCAFTPSGCG